MILDYIDSVDSRCSEKSPPVELVGNSILASINTSYFKSHYLELHYVNSFG